ncbi:hypothetical protein [Rhodohalobacter sp. SW132]|uniref:hypothetical protein n=1 Tax=Rhodohalobacter sp. SW132 TaxID=2293433 RepID=UPI0013152FD5|nr:hypothetical protein [Rhodohalobacter sp. SW132]
MFVEKECDNRAEGTKGDDSVYKMPMAAGLQTMMMERNMEVSFNHAPKLGIYRV